MIPIRSMIFTPGDRIEMVRKAIRSGADSVIVDLEDAVSEGNKGRARQILGELPETAIPLYVRVNASDTRHFWDDINSAAQAPIAGVVLPKVEDPNVVREVGGALSALESGAGKPAGSIGIVPLLESAMGVMRAYEVLSASRRIEATLFGSGEYGDMPADLEAEWSPDGTGMLGVRSLALLAARAAKIPYPMEAVFMDFRNLDALREECLIARKLGYVGKVAIHPMQVPVIHEVFTPNVSEVEHQRHILSEFDAAVERGVASVAVDGLMVDYAVARMAKTVLRRAEVAALAEARQQGEMTAGG